MCTQCQNNPKGLEVVALQRKAKLIVKFLALKAENISLQNRHKQIRDTNEKLQAEYDKLKAENEKLQAELSDTLEWSDSSKLYRQPVIVYAPMW